MSAVWFTTCLCEATDDSAYGTIAASITADFSAAAVATESNPAAIQADITGDIQASASVHMTIDATSTIAVDITGDITAAAVGIGGVIFLPPKPGHIRVAVVTHAD